MFLVALALIEMTKNFPPILLPFLRHHLFPLPPFLLSLRKEMVLQKGPQQLPLPLERVFFVVYSDCSHCNCALLERWGYDTADASEGLEGLDRIKKSNIRIVVCDWMMPGMTGLDVALAIQQTSSPPKVILLSSWTLPSSEHLERVDAFLAKPIKREQVFEQINKWVLKRDVDIEAVINST